MSKHDELRRYLTDPAIKGALVIPVMQEHLVNLIEDYDKIVDEVGGYLEAASAGSMSRNNSEQLAAELLDLINQSRGKP